MEQLLELLTQIYELAGAGVDALTEVLAGEGGAPAEGAEAPGAGEAPAPEGAPPDGPPQG